MKTRDQLLEQIKPEWTKNFLTFIETGEASEEFLNYLDSDSEAQSAAEDAFRSQAEKFRQMAVALQEPVGALCEELQLQTISQNLASSLEGVVNLSLDEINNVTTSTVSILERTLEPEERRRAQQIAKNISSGIRHAVSI